MSSEPVRTGEETSVGSRKQVAELTEPQRFEEALEHLESLVDELENGRLGLEVSLAKYEDGIRLLRRCHAILQDAEQKIEILTGFNSDGTARTDPFDVQATFDESAAAGKKPSRRKGPAKAGDTESEQRADPSAGGERRLF
jgi:exodeoxyribonuclease VII small subunit